MFYIVIVLGSVLVIFLPQIWVKHILRKHRTERLDFPGTGGELAEHLIQRFALDHICVKQSQSETNFYDPINKQIYLSRDCYQGRSITAVAIAVHEIGHVIQQHTNYPPFIRRQKRIYWANKIERVSTGILMLSPVVVFLLRMPQGFILTLIAGGAGLLATLCVHISNLPVEFDASFNRALPILKEGYLLPTDILAAKQVLRAAAFTYVAAALSYLLNISRWFFIFKR